MLDAEEQANTSTNIFNEDSEPLQKQENRGRNEDVNSTPRTKEFLPDFGCQRNSARLRAKKIKSESDRPNSEERHPKIAFSDRAIRSRSKKSSFEIKLPQK